MSELSAALRQIAQEAGLLYDKLGPSIEGEFESPLTNPRETPLVGAVCAVQKLGGGLLPRRGRRWWKRLLRAYDTDNRAKYEKAADKLAAWAEREADAKRRPTTLEWFSKATLYLRDHPEWSDAEIARRVGVSKTRLSRSEDYQALARITRHQDAPLRGRVEIDREGRRHVEAIDPDAADPADLDDE